MHKNIIELLEKYNEVYKDDAYIVRKYDSRGKVDFYDFYYKYKGKSEFNGKETAIKCLWVEVYKEKIKDLIKKLDKKEHYRELRLNTKGFKIFIIKGKLIVGEPVYMQDYMEWLNPELIQYTDEIIKNLESQLIEPEQEESVVYYEKHFLSTGDSIDWVNEKIEQGCMLYDMMSTDPVGIYVVMKQVGELKEKEQEKEKQELTQRINECLADTYRVMQDKNNGIKFVISGVYVYRPEVDPDNIYISLDYPLVGKPATFYSLKEMEEIYNKVEMNNGNKTGGR